MNTTIKRPVWYLLTLHWVSLAGSAIVTTAVLSFLFVLPLQMNGHVDNPYIGIIVFLILPVIFFAGLLLIPIGIYLGKRRLQKDLVLQEPDRKTVIRRLAWFFGVTTILNIYDRNVFPELSVKWGTYPNSLCHTDFPVASDATTVLTQKREGGR